jgi:thymidylate synthase (FAD)
MQIIKPNFYIEEGIDGISILKKIEKAGRTCYKSDDLITEDSARKFVAGLIRSGHEAMIEHESVTVTFVCDRGVSHEIVRHRIASYAQESTRYCNYGKEKFGSDLTFIDIRCTMQDEIGKTYKHPVTKKDILITVNKVCYWVETWLNAISFAEDRYMELVNSGCPAQLARSVLPNSIKTEIVVTMNLREWRHFFKLRAIGTTGKPHPQMVELAQPLLYDMAVSVPVVFDDLVDLLPKG